MSTKPQHQSTATIGSAFSNIMGAIATSAQVVNTLAVGTDKLAQAYCNIADVAVTRTEIYHTKELQELTAQRNALRRIEVDTAPVVSNQ